MKHGEFLFTLGFVLRSTRERDWFFHEFFPTMVIPIVFATLLFVQYLAYIFIFLFIIAWQYKEIKKVMLEIYRQCFHERGFLKM